MFHEDICTFPTINIYIKLNYWLLICIAKNFIWTTLKMIFSIFRCFCMLTFHIFKYCPIITNHTSMEILFIHLDSPAAAREQLWSASPRPPGASDGPFHHEAAAAPPPAVSEKQISNKTQRWNHELSLWFHNLAKLLISPPKVTQTTKHFICLKTRLFHHNTGNNSHSENKHFIYNTKWFAERHFKSCSESNDSRNTILVHVLNQMIRETPF